ncbi:hypothetical protein BKA69DRAFT_1036990 [Paraphysoderma sedebokerense]|nr:hypothetical protein BKA69DRAFT_1036990 [Paraphysoderma sedebokerense]
MGNKSSNHSRMEQSAVPSKRERPNSTSSEELLRQSPNHANRPSTEATETLPVMETSVASEQLSDLDDRTYFIDDSDSDDEIEQEFDDAVNEGQEEFDEEDEDLDDSDMESTDDQGEQDVEFQDPYIIYDGVIPSLPDDSDDGLDEPVISLSDLGEISLYLIDSDHFGTEYLESFQICNQSSDIRADDPSVDNDLVNPPFQNDYETLEDLRFLADSEDIQNLLQAPNVVSYSITQSDSQRIFKAHAGLPLQFTYSPSTANHFQCAGGLTLGPVQNVVKLKVDHLGRDVGKEIVRMQRPIVFDDLVVVSGGWKSFPENYMFDYVCNGGGALGGRWKEHINGCDLIPFTKNFITCHNSGPHLMRQPHGFLLQTSPICITYAYGYLAIGTEAGDLFVHCLMEARPRLILLVEKSSTMFNSVQIVRWITRKDSGFEYSYSLVAARNSAKVDIWELPASCKGNHHPRKFNTISQLKTHPDDTVNAAYFSPNGKYLTCVGDIGKVWICPVIRSESDLKPIIGAPERISLPHQIEPYPMPDRPSAIGYHAWNAESTLFAVVLESCPHVLLIDPAKQSVWKKIPSGGPTFAISFNPSPKYSHLLAFANRNGYVHVIDIRTLRTSDTSSYSNSSSSDSDDIEPNENYYHVIIKVSHREHRVRDNNSSTEPQSSSTEITENSVFKRLKEYKLEEENLVNDKINGLEWSFDGLGLYVATKHRVLYYPIQTTPTLKQLAQQSIQSNHFPLTPLSPDDSPFCNGTMSTVPSELKPDGIPDYVWTEIQKMGDHRMIGFERHDGLIE